MEGADRLAQSEDWVDTNQVLDDLFDAILESAQKGLTQKAEADPEFAKKYPRGRCIKCGELKPPLEPFNYRGWCNRCQSVFADELQAMEWEEMKNMSLPSILTGREHGGSR